MQRGRESNERLTINKMEKFLNLNRSGKNNEKCLS